MEQICQEATAHILADEAVCKLFGSPLTVKPMTRTTCKQADGVIANHYCTYMVEGPETMGIASVNATQDGVTDIEMHIDDRTIKVALNSDVKANLQSSRAADDEKTADAATVVSPEEQEEEEDSAEVGAGVAAEESVDDNSSVGGNRDDLTNDSINNNDDDDDDEDRSNDRITSDDDDDDDSLDGEGVKGLKFVNGDNELSVDPPQRIVLTPASA